MTNKATFYYDVVIQFNGHRGATGSEIEVEIEYTATRPIRATHTDPADPGEIEIVRERPFIEKRDEKYQRIHGSRTYLDCPEWLARDLIDCIDTDEFEPDWGELDDYAYDMRHDMRHDAVALRSTSGR